MWENCSEVANFYSKKSVLLTGGTGYIGQVMIEKLLFYCNDIDKIYVLIRPKKHLSPTQRVKEITDNEIFSRIRLEKPDVLKKIEPVNGELTKPNLGLSIECQQDLIRNVSVVFHVAATISFEEPLKIALAINIEGTLQILELSKRMEKLDAFVHVSTAFCNITRRYIKEKVYSPPASLEQLYQILEEHKDDEDIKPLLGKYPNTYTFTKTIAEYEVKMNRGDCPVAIVRPSIVLSAYKEPLEGWLNNWNGPTTLLYHGSMGTVRFMAGNSNFVADVIPADIVSNMAIVAATACKKSNELKVYNCCSGPRNPITWHELQHYLSKKAVAMEHNKLPFPRLTYIKSRTVVTFLSMLLLTLPMFLMDCWLWVTGKPRLYMKHFRRMIKIEQRMNFGTSSQWDFEDGNVRALVDSMSPVDRQLFYCDPAEVQWKKYVEDYYLGIRKYLLKAD